MGSDVTEEQAIWRDDAIMRSPIHFVAERRYVWRLVLAIVAARIPAGAFADGSEREG